MKYSRMNERENGDLNFDYIQQLCQAIEDFTKSKEAVHPQAFIYRGANLKYAVERALYFFAVDHERLRFFFRQWTQQQLPEIAKFNTVIERDLAFFIANKEVELNCLKAKYKTFYYLLNWQKDLVSQLFLNNQSNFKSVQEEIVLFAVDHKKFVKFFEPVTRNLSIPYAYLLHPQTGIKSLLSSIGIQKYLIEKQLYSVNISKKINLKKQPDNFFVDLPLVANLYNYYYATLKKLKPKCVVVPEGNHIQDEIINQIGKQLSIPVICLQQGWSPIIHNGFRHMSYTKMLVWGQGFADLLQPYNPSQKFVITGSHIVKYRSVNSVNSATTRKGISFFLQSPNKLGNTTTWHQFLELIRWTAKEFVEVPILVREHPQFLLPSKERKRLQAYSNVKLVSPSSYSLAAVLADSMLVVAIYSTTILEGIAAGVLPLIFNVTSMPSYYPDVQAAGAGIEVKNLEAAKQALRRVITDQTYIFQFEAGMKKFRNQYFADNNSQKAIEKITKEICEVISTNHE